MAKIYFDAASNGNPGMSTYGIAIVDNDVRETYSGFLGEMDNHSAEWEAMLLALDKAHSLNIRNALLHTDSKLIEEAVEREFVRNPVFQNYLKQYFIKAQLFDLSIVKWVPRAQNKEANHLAQNALFQLKNNKSK
ncbi:ribonuclease HI family protein [Staphylococcus canis]|uniref:Ribonuclease HI family protein n=1 Tax=Staphylococcus canis TaxID=2724942 RepID=A0ABS0T9P9_9STAP|nr:ribonuclease HI family protein [Staphylococcus canis]MBI5975476.1 ribonuclease HI family protein [Staphylococcus canis]